MTLTLIGKCSRENLEKKFRKRGRRGAKEEEEREGKRRVGREAKWF